jgi:hypothetical protein
VKTTVRHIARAMIEAGYDQLGVQTKVLGLHRATVWTIMNSKRKCDRLQRRTTDRILASPRLPPNVRDVVTRYVKDRNQPR